MMAYGMVHCDDNGMDNLIPNVIVGCDDWGLEHYDVKGH